LRDREKLKERAEDQTGLNVLIKVARISQIRPNARSFTIQLITSIVPTAETGCMVDTGAGPVYVFADIDLGFGLGLHV
jgi:hypothetical protein